MHGSVKVEHKRCRKMGRLPSGVPRKRKCSVCHEVRTIHKKNPDICHRCYQKKDQSLRKMTQEQRHSLILELVEWMESAQYSAEEKAEILELDLPFLGCTQVEIDAELEQTSTSKRIDIGGEEQSLDPAHRRKLVVKMLKWMKKARLSNDQKRRHLELNVDYLDCIDSVKDSLLDPYDKNDEREKPVESLGEMTAQYCAGRKPKLPEVEGPVIPMSIIRSRRKDKDIPARVCGTCGRDIAAIPAHEVIEHPELRADWGGFHTYLGNNVLVCDECGGR
jgi:hypothetical protein